MIKVLSSALDIITGKSEVSKGSHLHKEHTLVVSVEIAT